MKKAEFSKKQAVKFGFTLTRKHFLFFLEIFIIVVFFTALSSSLRFIINSQKELVLYLAAYLILAVINYVIGIGLIKISLEFVDGKKPKFLALFYYKPIVKYILASAVQGIIILLGFILLIIPGVILAIRLQYSRYLVVDKNLGPIEAVKTSWKITRGNTWNLFFFAILLVLINILGILCFLVGLFVTAPLSMLAFTFVYRKLLNVSK